MTSIAAIAFTGELSQHHAPGDTSPEATIPNHIVVNDVRYALGPPIELGDLDGVLQHAGAIVVAQSLDQDGHPLLWVPPVPDVTTKEEWSEMDATHIAKQILPDVLRRVAEAELDPRQVFPPQIGRLALVKSKPGNVMVHPLEGPSVAVSPRLHRVQPIVSVLTREALWADLGGQLPMKSEWA